MMAGMDFFNAVAHAMTTIATGGFSTYDASIGHFNSAAVDTVSIMFMIIGSLPFVLYLHAIRGNPQPLWKDSQVRWFFILIVSFILIATIYQIVVNANVGTRAFQLAAFNVVSVMTGTGYATADYGTWGPFAVVFFFCIMFIGGCSGSTSCGMKIFRFQIIFEMIRCRLQAVIYPKGVFVERYNGAPIANTVTSAVMGFFFLFMLCFAVIATLLTFIGLDTVTALSAAASAVANVGPGLGQIVGPVGNYATLPDSAKWVLAFGMLLGRLEIFTVLVLFTPTYWRS